MRSQPSHVEVGSFCFLVVLLLLYLLWQQNVHQIILEANVEFAWVGGPTCKVILMSTPVLVEVVLWLSCDNFSSCIICQVVIEWLIRIAIKTIKLTNCVFFRFITTLTTSQIGQINLNLNLNLCWLEVC